MGKFDPAPVRAQFPIFSAPLRPGVTLHYLDNAATSQMPAVVMDAVRAHDATRRANVKRGVHTLAERATDAFEAARTKLARFLNAADPDEIVFTSGATGALNLAANSFGALLKTGDEVVLSVLEHHSNLVPWQMLRDRSGVVLRFLPATAEGHVDVGALGRTVTQRTKLIAVTHVSNVTGAITDVAAITRAAREVGARVLLDGSQRVSHGPVDVQTLGCDLYALSSHKMFGPNGVGALWGKAELLAQMPPFLGGGEMIRTVTLDRTTYAKPPHRFEAGTPPIAQAVGLGAAIDWMNTLDHGAVATHLGALTQRILKGLADLGGGNGRVRVVGPPGLHGRVPVVSFAVDGAHPHDICQMLDTHGVALRGGHHCAQPFMESCGLGGTTRASLAPYNDDGDVDALLNGLEDALAKLS